MIAALLLAAGGSRRFGGDKLMAPLADGTPVAVATLRTLRSEVDEVVAVVRPDAPISSLLAAEGARLVVCTDPDRGSGHSIAQGAAFLTEARADGCILAHADMPHVRARTVARLVAALRAGFSLVAPEYHGTRGQPVAFSAFWFPRLNALTGDDGARHLLAVHRHALFRLAVDDTGILADVDRPADLKLLDGS